MSIQNGDSLPSGSVFAAPGKSVDPAEALASGVHIVFGVPGAFTPGCNNTHLPSYLASFDAFTAKGVKSISCISVNDAFVMGAWGKATGAEGKIAMWADPAGAYTKALGLEVNAASLGGLRSKRFAMIVENGAVKHLEVEPDGFGLTCSLAPSLAEYL